LTKTVVAESGNRPAHERVLQRYLDPEARDWTASVLPGHVGRRVSPTKYWFHSLSSKSRLRRLQAAAMTSAGN